MNKRDFYSRMVPLLKEEPSREQWETMFEIHQRDPYATLENIVSRVMDSDGRIVDRRRILQEFQGKIVSLETLSAWGKEMSEKFKKGTKNGRNDHSERSWNGVG